MSDTACEVCTKSKSIAVVASGFVPHSFAICQLCFDAGSEPWRVLVYVAAEVSEEESVPWLEPYIANLLVCTGKSRTDFDQDVKKCREHMAQPDG